MFFIRRDTRSLPLPNIAVVDTVFLLHFEGPNNSSVTYDNAGGHGLAVNGLNITTVQYKFGSSCGYFAGNTYITTSSSPDWAMGQGDFTVDCWIKRVAVQGSIQTIVGQAGSTLASKDGGIYLKINADNCVEGGFTSKAGSKYGVKSTTPITDTTTWHHIALVREVENLRLFVDGVLCEDYAVGTTANYSDCSLSVGRMGDSTDSSYYFYGYIDELRIVKGKAMWQGTSSFTPPTAAYNVVDKSVTDIQAMRGVTDVDVKLLLHMNGQDRKTVFTDECGYPVTSSGVYTDAVVKKFGISSAYFNGSSCLSVPDSTDWFFSNNSFTIDFWVKWVPGTYGYICAQTDSDNPSYCSFSINVDEEGTLGINLYQSSSVFTSINTSHRLDGNWHHIAVVRNNYTQFFVFFDGIPEVGSLASDFVVANCPTPLYIGRYGNYAGMYFTGWIDEFRISTKARWTGAFSVPKAPYGKSAREYQTTSRQKRRVILPNSICIGR